MAYKCILLLIIGIVMAVYGLIKAVKSDFNDADAIIWVCTAELPILLGTLLAIFI